MENKITYTVQYVCVKVYEVEAENYTSAEELANSTLEEEVNDAGYLSIKPDDFKCFIRP